MIPGLEDLVHESAQGMLDATLQVDVSEYIQKHARSMNEHGHRLVVGIGARRSYSCPTWATRFADSKRLFRATTVLEIPETSLAAKPRPPIGDRSDQCRSEPSAHYADVL